MIRRPPRSTLSSSSAASDVYKRQMMMNVIFRMLATHLGTPPVEFFWQWRDKGGTFHRDGSITPQDFFGRYVGIDLENKVCLINCPTPDKPMNHLYTLSYLGNVIEAKGIRYMNTPIEAFKQAAIDMLVAGRPVWF